MAESGLTAAGPPVSLPADVQWLRLRWRVRKLGGDWTITPPGSEHPIDAAFPSQPRALVHALLLARLTRTALQVTEAVHRAHRATQGDFQLEA